MNIKKIICIAAVTACFFLTLSPVQATEYTTDSGIILTEEEYNKLREVLSDDTIRSMPKNYLEDFLNSDNIRLLSKETIYVQTDETFSEDGDTLLNVTSKVVSKEVANRVAAEAQIQPLNASASHTTSMKAITTSIADSGGGYRLLSVVCNWMSLPKTRSYDVIGVRPTTSCVLYTTSGTNNVWGVQNTDAGIFNYNYGSEKIQIDGTKISGAYRMSGSGGAGISMNLSNTANSKITCTMNMVVSANTLPIGIYGSYQHATESVSLSSSQNYSFDSSGFGNVFKFGLTVRGKYDNTKGVYVSSN